MLIGIVTCPPVPEGSNTLAIVPSEFTLESARYTFVPETVKLVELVNPDVSNVLDNWAIFS